MDIEIKCDTCKTSHTVERTSEIDKVATSMGCNWCPKCEDSANNHYHEWAVFDKPIDVNKLIKQQ